MAIFWKCKTTSNSEYYKKIDYVSDPSLDLIEGFKKKIAAYRDPARHENYVPGKHAERQKNHLLFILGNRVEILVRPDYEDRKLYFVDCNDT